MTTGMSDGELFDLVRRKVETSGFYLHFGLYCAFNAVLVIIWRFTGKGFPWFVYPLGIWGILVIYHLMRVSVLYNRLKPSERSIKRIEGEVQRLKGVQRLKEEARLEKERLKAQKK